MNIGSLITKAARAYPDRVAVRLGPTALTYSQLNDAAGRFSAGLRRRGLVIGDRVVIYMKNRPEYVVALVGSFKAGLVVVPVNAKLHASELAFIVGDSEAKALVYGPEVEEAIHEIRNELAGLLPVRTGGDGAGIAFSDLLAEEPGSSDTDLQPDDLAWLFYTSGTTGRPKGAMLSHRNLERMSVNCLADICTFQPEDIVLHVASLSHGGGLYLLPSLARGAENVIFEGESFEPADVLGVVERERVTVLAFVVPTMIVKLLDAPPELGAANLRCVIYGGSSILVEHARAAVERFGPIFVQLYGQGESPMTITGLRARDHVSADGAALASAGIPRTDVELRVVDGDDHDVRAGEVGEVLVRGDVVMSGYWRNPEATAETLRGGWLHTGDLGRFGGDGRLYLVDRTKDMIISGGSNIYPREVEDALILHPGVHEVVVFGVPDHVWGEIVAAAVVPEPGWKPSEAELVEHCRSLIASYKKPRLVEFVDELPRNAAGKVLRRELRSRASG